MANTDFIALAILVVAVFNGWRKGAVRSFIAPGAFLLSFFMGIIVLDVSENIVKALSFVAIASVILSMIGSLIFYLSRRNMNAEDKNFVFSISRFLGILINTSWQFLLIGATLIILTALPANTFGLEKITADIQHSRTYSYIQFYLLNRTPIIYTSKETLVALSHPDQLEKLRKTSQFQAIEQDPKIQDILQDPWTMSQVKNKDVIGLISNPRVQALFEDEELSEKLSKLSRLVFREKMKKSGLSAPCKTCLQKKPSPSE